jgi:UDP-glucose 4-epimerase
VAGANPDILFHLAAQVDLRASVSDPLFDARSNVLGTINVLTAAAAEKIPVVQVLTTTFFDTSGGPLTERSPLELGLSPAAPPSGVGHAREKTLTPLGHGREKTAAAVGHGRGK